MPFKIGKSREAFEHNFKKEMASGKSREQSLAIAYSVQREASARKNRRRGKREK